MLIDDRSHRSAPPRFSQGLRAGQRQVYHSGARFRIVAAGRRFGKTHLALTEMVRVASRRNRTVWYIAPSYRQAKSIAWRRLKTMTRPHWRQKPSESELSITLTSGSVLALRGADHPDSLRGNGLDFVVIDEFASIRPECWTEVLRPALADRRGRALFIGTPQGCNHFFDRFEQAKTDPEWATWQFTTQEGGNVSAAELLAASRDLDQQTFRQEFEASFEGAGLHRVYYAFERASNVQSVAYSPGEPLVWTIDFNVDPMSSLLIQRIGDNVHVLDEIILQPDANTVQACEALHERTKPFCARGTVKLEVYGDASGHQRRSSASATDWTLIREFFARWRGAYVPSIRAANVNPAVRDRINCVNARLQNAVGERRLFIDPRCRELIRDLERVTWTLDSTGRPTTEINKSDRRRTHSSDALGYYVSQAFAMRPNIGEKSDGRLF